MWILYILLGCGLMAGLPHWSGFWRFAFISFFPLHVGLVELAKRLPRFMKGIWRWLVSSSSG
jgi:hypothetical protein